MSIRTIIAKAEPVEFITSLGKNIATCPAYSALAIEHLRKVYVLAKTGDPRWMQFLQLWSDLDAFEDEKTLVAHFVTAYFDKKYAEDEARKNDAPAPAKLVKPTSDGMYRNPETGEIFKVQYNKAQGDAKRLYAKKMIGWTAEFEQIEQFTLTGDAVELKDVEFIYKSGLIFAIDASWKMTMEQAKAFGALYGTCCRCGRTLTLEKSIEQGMGRKCASYFS